MCVWREKPTVFNEDMQDDMPFQRATLTKTCADARLIDFT